jgi:ABC-type uncharacterized transport system permease subunit
MKYIIAFILIIGLYSCCNEDRNRLFVVEVTYQASRIDTLRVIGEQDSRFYLRPYGESQYLGCTGVGAIVYNVESYKILN